MNKHGKKNKRIKRVRGIRKHKQHIKQAKASQKKCALFDTTLLGVPHGKKRNAISKLAKTKRRPTGLFGGVLSSKARTVILEETLKLKIGEKPLEEVELEKRVFVEQALQHLKKKA